MSPFHAFPVHVFRFCNFHSLWLLFFHILRAHDTGLLCLRLFCSSFGRFSLTVLDIVFTTNPRVSFSLFFIAPHICLRCKASLALPPPNLHCVPTSLARGKEGKRLMHRWLRKEIIVGGCCAPTWLIVKLCSRPPVAPRLLTKRHTLWICSDSRLIECTKWRIIVVSCCSWCWWEWANEVDVKSEESRLRPPTFNYIHPVSLSRVVSTFPSLFPVSHSTSSSSLWPKYAEGLLFWFPMVSLHLHCTILFI